MDNQRAGNASVSEMLLMRLVVTLLFEDILPRWHSRLFKKHRDASEVWPWSRIRRLMRRERKP
jgi:hypothetical protein